MTAKKPGAPARSCTNCGAPVQPGGRPSKTGNYWCQKSECQRDKAARRYSEQNAGGMAGKMAPVVCSFCNDAMPARRARWSDIPGKRWCNKPQCRADRSTFMKNGDGQNFEAYDVLTKRLWFLHYAAVMPRETCSTCGADDALTAFIHPTPERKVCSAPAQGGDYLTREDLQAAYYARLQTTPATLTAPPE